MISRQRDQERNRKDENLLRTIKEVVKSYDRALSEGVHQRKINKLKN